MSANHSTSSPDGGPANRRPVARRLAVALVVVAVATIAGVSCSSGESIEALLPLQGTYTLRAVNGSAIPFQDGSTFVVRGTITFQSNSHYNFSETDSAATGLTTTASTGLWDVTLNAIAMHGSDGTLYLATANQAGDSVFALIGGHTSTYVK